MFSRVMAKRTLYLAAYDVSDPKRLRQALEVLKDYSTGGQKSVFECFMTPGEKAELLRRALGVIDRKEDRFLLLKLGEDARTIVLGVAREPKDEAFFYVG